VRAAVGQDCVVTLEPLDNEIDEPIDLIFAPAGGADAHGAAGAAGEGGNDATPEPLVGEMVDLGAIATEFLLLAIDPYPRKPEAVFQPPSDAGDAAHPFAALAALKKGHGGKAG
jgi:Large ribosomal RNA subunit accumulation protein YceD